MEVPVKNEDLDDDKEFTSNKTKIIGKNEENSSLTKASKYDEAKLTKEQLPITSLQLDLYAEDWMAEDFGSIDDEEASNPEIENNEAEKENTTKKQILSLPLRL